jgi:miniconductance mechanosensitive channel
MLSVRISIGKTMNYIMADIFDRLIAAVPYFNLEIFKLPDNKDVRVRK